MILKVYKIRPDAKLPVRAHPADAGMDLFYCPSGNKKLYDCTKAYHIPPHSSRVLSTGLKMEIPYGYMLEVKNKSGIASKRQLLVGACVIDAGYDGEIYVNLHNVGSETQIVRPGEKLAQAVMMPVAYCRVEEQPDDTRMNKHSERGAGGFGSTGDR